ncbi:MAG: PAS domain-containing protein, partial [Anaerolineae bacterium]|nr:PAS domain-containing protein [Anaerolineae bacterium]
MVWQYNPYFFSLALVAALAFALAVYLFCRRPGPGSIPLACFMIAMGIWALAYGMEIGSQTVPMVKLAAKLQYFGISPGPLLWFFFALDFTGRHRWLKFPLVALLLLVPLVTLVMVWTSDLHPFMINNVILDTRYEFSRMTWRPGFWMWIDSLYGYSLMFSGTVLCLVALRRVSSLFRVQALLISVGLLLPMVTSLIYILQIGSTLKSLNVVPFAFTTAGALLTLGLSRWNLLDIVPVARSVLVEKMRDPVVVLDVRQRIVDLNPAALQLIGRSFEDVLGCQIGEVIPFLPPITEPYLNHAQVCSEVALGTEEVPRTFDVRITPLRNRQDRLRGHLLVLHDISALQAALQQARAADLAKSQFVNNVSHELRTPLTSIKLYLDLLSIGSEARRGEYFQSIHRETARLQTLIEDLLMISRLDLGKLNMSPVTVSVNQLVQMLVQDRREVFAQHELALVLDV